MNTNLEIQRYNFRRRSGAYALLLLVLCLAAASLLLLAVDMNRTTTIGKLNLANNQYSVLNNAAQAAAEKVYSVMARDFAANGPGVVSNNVTASTYQPMVPNSTDNAYWSNFAFSDAQGNTNKIYVGFLTNYTGPMPTQYTNEYATTSPIYRIIVNASMPGAMMTNVIGTAQEDIMLAEVPITTFAIFYNGELEFSDCATMTVLGRVHSNSDICTGAGASSTLTFGGAVTTSSVLWTPERGGITFPTTGSSTVYNSTTATNVPTEQISIPMTNTIAIIQIPPPGESVSSATGSQREYNKAQVVLIVTNSPLGGGPAVNVIFQTSVNGNLPGNNVVKTLSLTNLSLSYSNNSYLSTNSIVQLPFLSLTNTFVDQRQSSTAQLVTQINVMAYHEWVRTNSTLLNYISPSSGNYPTILYVADMRYVTTNTQAVVRLVNGQMLPTNNCNGINLGWSVATPNPLYVWGNYNTTIDGTHFALSPNSTTNGYNVPAALFCDAITVLSSNWQDRLSGASYTSRSNVTMNMTINAAIITGNVPSTGTTSTTFSGGVHNLTRMLENWGSVDLIYNTSIICLFTSQMATNQFGMPYSTANGGNANGYYNPPTRQWGFDPNFYNPNMQPPGAPCALIPIRFNWVVPAPNSLASQ